MSERGILVLDGRVDVLTVGLLREALLGAVDAGVGDLVVDAGGLAFVDTTGLGALLSAHRRCRRAGRRLVLRRPPDDLLRLLNRTRLSRVLAIEIDLTDATAEGSGDAGPAAGLVPGLAAGLVPGLAAG